MNLALACVEPLHTKPGSEAQVLLNGETNRATVCPISLFILENTLPRGIE